MAIRDTNSLKMAFETGKIPQQQDFHDLIDSAVVASSGITPLAPADTMAAPNGSKRYVATAAGTYNNLKLADGSAAPAISVSGEELSANIVYLIYTASSNSWSKVIQNIAAGPIYTSIAANATTVTSNTTCVIDKFYVADSGLQITFTLPSIAAEGSLIGIAAKNVGGFKVATGGYLMIDGFNLGDDYLECPQYSTVIIRCVEVNTGWVIESYAGKLYNLGYSRYFTHIPAITSDTNTNLISTALSYTTSGSPADNVFMSKSGSLVGTNNVVIGERSLVSHSGTCTSSVIIGSTAGYIGGAYTNITAVGMQAALRVFTSYWSSYFGKGAGRYSSNHYYSIFIGAESGNYTDTISYSFILGFQTASGASNISNGFIVSNYAGYGINGSNNDIIIGVNAGRYLTGTSHNILIGYNAGSEVAGNATGNYNVIIGTNVTLPDGTNNGLNIGGVLFGTGLNDDTSGDPKHNPTSTGKIGIGTNAPKGVLDVVSTTNGSLPFPRMTASQRTAISSPSVGTHVYQTDGTEGVYVYKSGGWAFAY
ncbi:MAG: hypothetical protein LC101_03090 [Flavobacteriales bacterium]|nr:hypothetical protein [Flavobacteriales bacterium]